MSKILAQLLGQPEEAVDKTITVLEDYCGYPSHDVRLLAEINNLCRTKTADLRLDPDDTKGKELYHSLLNRLEKDNSRLTATGLAKSDYLTQLVRQMALPDVWVLKHSVAKELLRTQPPRKLMRLFNCRSVDSMLKRQNVAQLYSLLPSVESSRYLTNIRRAESRLRVSDFEQRAIEFLTMPKNQASGKPVTNIPEIGVIAIWQPAGRLSKIPGMQILYMLTAIEELLLRSSLIKLRRSQSDFGKQLIKILNDEADSPAELAGQLAPWSCVVHHYAHQPAADQQIFEPYLLPEDFRHQKPLEQLANIHPAFRWWTNTAHVASHHRLAKPVSLNIMDVLSNYLSQTPYRRRTFGHFQQALWQELFGRYLKQAAPDSNLHNWLTSQPAMESLPIASQDQYQPYNQSVGSR